MSKVYMVGSETSITLVKIIENEHSLQPTVWAKHARRLANWHVISSDGTPTGGKERDLQRLLKLGQAAKLTNSPDQ